MIARVKRVGVLSTLLVLLALGVGVGRNASIPSSHAVASGCPGLQAPCIKQKPS